MGVKLGLWALREEHRLKLFEKRVLRRIFGPKRDKMREGWKELQLRTTNMCEPLRHRNSGK
jgi:hypothetical protein